MNHLINNRNLTTFNALEQELSLQTNKNYLFDLSYLSVIDVIGDKTLEFLQGQLTCNVNTISDIQIAQGTLCNLQGRVLTLMDVVNWSGIKLILPKDLLEATIKSLNKPAMLSRVTTKENQHLCVLGFYLQNQQDMVPDTSFFPTELYALTYGKDYCCYHLGSGFYIFLIQTDFAAQIKHRFSKQEQLLGSLTWHTFRLQQKQFDIYPESRGLFLPHRLELHKTPYLSFNKGCYKGQEIIARMHYKATLKHELRICSVNTNEKIHSGQKLLNEQCSELGELIDYSPQGENNYLIAVSILKNSNQLVVFENSNTPIYLKRL
ncbi:MAG: folate-binding protein YgfZ [Legionella sp.]|uniref:CAF17-like 4Fe-4S cluster assembly/insertion protein YgfZ n=1 Tax=Legionella sp. TaxID=459 RepID=UPI0039E2DD96